ncbi:MAG TPA: glycoside hydrolase family 76 protein [Verrucomicrobiae bacterium]|nr:glycoside hydrolase family 76 protein [Verrucomicrobiae bacterium]
MAKMIQLKSVWIRLLCLTILLCGFKASAFYSNDVATIVNAYTNKFYVVSGTNGYFRENQANANYTYFWWLANEIECVIDAHDWTSNATYQVMITNLLNGFKSYNGTNWSSNSFNDDIMWACMAYARGYLKTGNPAFLDIAKNNFDMCYARGWDTNGTVVPPIGGMFWTTANNSKNSAVNFPAAIAAYLLYQCLGDPAYLTKATNIYTWGKANFFNPANGQVYDSLSSQVPTTYNQGTFIGAADFLGLTNDAILAANYTKNNMGSSGFMPQYGIAQNNSIFNAICIRWLAKFMKHRGLESSYQVWLQNLANAAWNGRRASDNLSWCQWPQRTPEGTNFFSYDCISSFEAMIAVPPSQTVNPTTVTLSASDTGSSSFESGLNWSDGTAPSSAHDYVVNGLTLRTPPDGLHHYFAGSSLTLTNNGILACKNTSGGRGISVGTDLFLDNGEVADWANNSATFYGNVTLRAGGGKFDPQGNTFTISAFIGGPGFLKVKAANPIQSGGTLIFSGYNTYTGGTIIDAADTVRLSGTGSLGDTNGSLTFSNSAGNGYGSVDLNGLDLGVGNLSGIGGKIYNGNTNLSTLTIGNGDAAGGIFQGSIWNGTGGIELVKTGVGTISFARNTNYVNGGLIVSGGTLVVSNALLAISNQLAIASAGNVNSGTITATLDVSASTNFTANVNTIQLGISTNTSGGSPVILGTLKLGTNNTLNAASSIVFGDMGNTFNTTAQSVTTADNGSTTMLTPSLTLGGSKASATFTLGMGSTLNLGNNGNRTALNIAASSRGGSGNYTGNLDCSGGRLNAWLSKLALGQLANGGNGNETGLLTMGGNAANHLDLAGSGTVVTVGQYLSGSGSGQSVGVLTLSNLDSSSVVVSTDNGAAILLGGTAKSAGTLNLNGGTLTITTTGPGIAGGAGTSTVNLDGITLKAGAGSAGYITNVTTVNVNAGGVAFDTAGFNLVIPQVLANGGGGLRKSGAGKLTLSKANTYAGDTVIGVGTLALVEPGSIASSASIIISNAAVLDVTGRSDQTLTLNNGRSLRGGGTLLGELNALSGSTINPGDTIGTLAVETNITLGGTLVMEINRGNVPLNDKLVSISGSIGGGGTLTVNNLGGALQGGDVFYLFNQPVDGFTTVNLPALTGGNVWQNNVAMDGSIRVVSTNAAVIATGIGAGNQLTLAWPADHIGWRLEVQTNALATGLGANWVDMIGAAATNVMTMPINPANGGVFFRLVFP